jgi:hypothetical protein
MVLAPLAAESQGPAARSGHLAPDEEPRFSQIASGLTQGLREQGHRKGTIHVRPACDAVPRLPIVFVTPGDPVEGGLVGWPRSCPAEPSWRCQA